MSYNVLEDRTYVLYIQSGDKVSGTNNNGNFFVDWAQFLPVKYNEYKMIFSFQTSGGYYKDNTAGTAIYSTAKVGINFGTRQFCYDTSSRGTTNTIGYISRDQQTTTSSSNVLSSFYYQYPAKSMARPSQNIINVVVTNMFSGLPLVTSYRQHGKQCTVRYDFVANVYRIYSDCRQRNTRNEISKSIII